MKKPHLAWYEILAAGQPLRAAKAAVVATPGHTTQLAAVPSPPREVAVQPGTIALAPEPPPAGAASLPEEPRPADAPASLGDPLPDPIVLTPGPVDRSKPQWLVRAAWIALRPLDGLLLGVALAMALALAFVVGRHQPLPVRPAPLPQAGNLDEIRANRPVRFEDLGAFPPPPRRKKA